MDFKPSEKINAREDKQSGTDDGEGPEEKPFLFHHARINEKEPKAVKGMENEEKEERKVKDFAQMEC
jgi:hypothetical protein